MRGREGRRESIIVCVHMFVSLWLTDMLVRVP